MAGSNNLWARTREITSDTLIGAWNDIFPPFQRQSRRLMEADEFYEVPFRVASSTYGTTRSSNISLRTALRSRQYPLRTSRKSTGRNPFLNTSVCTSTCGRSEASTPRAKMDVSSVPLLPPVLSFHLALPPLAYLSSDGR